MTGAKTKRISGKVLYELIVEVMMGWVGDQLDEYDDGEALVAEMRRNDLHTKVFLDDSGNVTVYSQDPAFVGSVARAIEEAGVRVEFSIYL